jgi:hypothetical protein
MVKCLNDVVGRCESGARTRGLAASSESVEQRKVAAFARAETRSIEHQTSRLARKRAGVAGVVVWSR